MEHTHISNNRDQMTRMTGIIVDTPQPLKTLGRGLAMRFSIRPLEPVGTSPSARNEVWPVIVFRPSSVGTLAAADRNDIIEIDGAVQDGQIIVPRNDGRISYLSHI